MKQLLDFIPLIIFFVLYKMQDIYVATGALIVATAVQVILTYFLFKKVEKMQLITFVMVALFGGMTIFLHDDNFIKWKVTIVYVLFALGLAISHAIGKSAIKGMLGKEISLPDHVWAKVTWAWVIFFSLCAGINIYVAYELPLDVWVNFKVFGLLAATFGYTIITGIYIYKHLPNEKS
ncbi:putative intracellular septation protein A [Vibrio zhanjiangensis]|uniref:Inner membrane-spanning protein YciB n=1 Tax=Vibrio zhanjiangensis TaxID=1046128 RepID=A0ABQ6F391_9VIBR|nr:septation protein A [Vibrio zhanjiangensis]GLT19988.1 putative intracellular septation protein A [Vibrio zhanjiangensis]